MSGKIHMVPALINDDYVIRFAVCAQHAVDDDVNFAWNVISEMADVISEMATDVLAMCDTNKETETLKEFHRIESLEVCTGLVNCIASRTSIYILFYSQPQQRGSYSSQCKPAYSLLNILRLINTAEVSDIRSTYVSRASKNSGIQDATHGKAQVSMS